MPCRCYLRSLHFNIYRTSYKSYSDTISHLEKLTLSVNQKTQHSNTYAKSFYNETDIIVVSKSQRLEYSHSKIFVVVISTLQGMEWLIF